MTCADCKVPYQGGTPGADTNTYVLFTSAGLPPRHFVYCGFGRITCSLLADTGEGGTLQLQATQDPAGLTGWQTVHDDVVAFVANETQTFDYLIANFDHFRLQFVNDGAPKTTWMVDTTIVHGNDPTQ
jgi:hypothetical protein